MVVVCFAFQIARMIENLGIYDIAWFGSSSRKSEANFDLRARNPDERISPYILYLRDRSTTRLLADSTQSPEQRNNLSMLKIHLRACNLFEATRVISNPTRSVIGFHADWWNSKSITYQVLINCICDDYDDQVILIIVQVLINYIPRWFVSQR